jgi:hypothetical protein
MRWMRTFWWRSWKRSRPRVRDWLAGRELGLMTEEEGEMREVYVRVR